MNFLQFSSIMYNIKRLYCIYICRLYQYSLKEKENSMRNKSGLFKQIISFLTALVVMCGMVLPSTITANAADKLRNTSWICD